MRRNIWIVFISAICLCLIYWATRYFMGNAPATEPLSPIAQSTLLASMTVSPLPAVTATPAPQAGQAAEYVVQTGDTLFNIAQSLGVSVETLIRLNQLEDPTRIVAGERLLIPQPETPFHPGDAPLSPVIAPEAIPPPPPMGQLQVNGVPLTTFLPLPESVQVHVQRIYADGQRMGRNPRAFSRMGDSTIQAPYFLTRFDEGPYDLGEYAYLQAMIDYFAGSFDRDSVAVRQGLHSWSIMDALWADKARCQPNEAILACEIRLHQPSFLFIRLGTNDAVDVSQSAAFGRNMRAVVRYAIEQGVVPIIGTKSDRLDGPENVINGILREVAAEYHVPLWDFDLVAGTLPDRGLEVDGIHLNSFYAHDYSQPQAFERGHAVHNLTALMVLDRLWRLLGESEP